MLTERARPTWLQRELDQHALSVPIAAILCMCSISLVEYFCRTQVPRLCYFLICPDLVASRYMYIIEVVKSRVDISFHELELMNPYIHVCIAVLALSPCHSCVMHWFALTGVYLHPQDRTVQFAQRVSPL